MKISKLQACKRFLKSYCSKILLFVLVPAISVLIYAALQNQLFLLFFEKEISNHYETIIQNISGTVDDNMKEILESTILFNSSDDFNEVYYSSQPYQKENQSQIGNVINLFGRYQASQSYVDSVFILQKSYRMIINSSGTFPYDDFFNKMYAYQNYPQDFWMHYKNQFDYNILSNTVVHRGSDAAFEIIPIIDNSLEKSHSHNLLVINLKVSEIEKLLSHSKPTTHSSLFILNAQKQTIAKTDDSASAQEMQKLLASLSGKSTVETRTFSGKNYLLIAVNNPHSTSTAFTYIAMIPVADIHQNSARVRMISILGILICMVISVCFSVFGVRKLYHPIKQLTVLFKVKQQKPEGWRAGPPVDEIQFLGNHILDILEDNEELSKSMVLAVPYINEHLLFHLLNHNLSVKEGSTEFPFLPQINALFPNPFFEVAVIRYSFKDDFYQHYTDEQRVKIDRQLCNIIKKNLPLPYPYFTVKLKQTVFAAVINVLTPGCEEEMAHCLSQFAALFQKDEAFISIRIALGRTYADIINISQSYNEALRAFPFLSEFNPEKVALFRPEGHKASYQYSSEEENRLYNYLFSNQFDKVTSLVETIVTRNLQNHVSENALKQIYIQIYNTISRVLAEKNLDIQTVMRKKYVDLLQEFPQLRADEISDYLNAVMQRLKSRADSCENKLDISQIKAYIDHNYTKDLYLDSLAEKFMTNPKYISKWLKKALGIPFKQYVTNLRIQKAKELLTETSKTIDQIAEEVGFNNRNPFVRAFKLSEGITPTEYRKERHSRTNQRI
ncbi:MULTISPECIES: helix-turn-helix domain-containing protein [Caproicibacterium]|uniref:Helix-turn-helix domain-containing protein n=1 Tax=Caproicibacterium argilliputei TaxID=3030016 RepID=A0AA97DA51_9FIRM|nr:helix-turn-helix domain-containing protein [Caproicibacterium argilliputei]WOC33101.1 helix-turn-helix domain-containing protein [Caproicibacterium argilliputei]